MIGPRLRELRTQAGLSLRDLAAAVHFSSGYLGKIENGHRVPGDELIRRCDAALEANGELIKAAEELLTETSSDTTSSARVWALNIGAGSDVPYMSIDHRLEAAAPVRPTYGITLPAFQAMFEEARILGQTLAPTALIPILMAQLDALRRMARQAHDTHRRELLILAARFAEYTGWMAQEAGSDEGASWWTDHACELASAAGDTDLAAYAFVRRGLISLYRHDAYSTVELARQAQRRTDNTRILGLAALREAQGHALVGDERSCQRCLDRARNLLDVPDPQEQPRFGTSTITDSVALATAWCLHDLGRPRAASHIFDNAIRQIPATAARARLRHTARYSLTLAAAGEIERACEIILPALDVLARTESATVRCDLRRLAQELSRARRNRAVRELAPQLSSALQVPCP